MFARTIGLQFKRLSCLITFCDVLAHGCIAQLNNTTLRFWAHVHWKSWDGPAINGANRQSFALNVVEIDSHHSGPSNVPFHFGLSPEWVGCVPQFSCDGPCHSRLGPKWNVFVPLFFFLRRTIDLSWASVIFRMFLNVHLFPI